MSKTKIIYFILLFSLFLAIPVIAQTPKANITLTWSCDSYIPLEYQGKALPIENSFIDVAVTIDALEFNPQDLTYLWSLNGQLQNVPNYGLGSANFKFKAEKKLIINGSITVKVNAIKNGSTVGSSAITIKIFRPEVIINPSEQVLTSNQNVQFIARPYFFNIKSSNEIDHQWILGNNPASRVDDEYSDVFFLTVGDIGQELSQNLTVRSENKSDFSQSAQNTIQLLFTP